MNEADQRPCAGAAASAAGGDAMIAVMRGLVREHARLSVPVEQLADDSDLFAVGLTSLATVNLMLAVEQEFDIEFPDAALSRRTFQSITALTGAVQQLCAGGEA